MINNSLPSELAVGKGILNPDRDKGIKLCRCTLVSHRAYVQQELQMFVLKRNFLKCGNTLESLGNVLETVIARVLSEIGI